MAKAGREGRNFEKRLTDLEEIVAKLEAGETSLEESLSLFEKGTGILKELTGILEEAERKIEVLTRDLAGNFSTEPFEEEQGE